MQGLREVEEQGLRKRRNNFVRIHQTLRITTAMAAGVTDRADIVALLEASEVGLERARKIVW